MSRNEVVGPRFEPVSLADEEEVKHVLVNSVLGLWDVVNNLTRLRPSRRDRYRVTIFGSARAKAGTFGYEETKRVAAALAEMGCDIITGGGPGLMQAANEGAATSPAHARSIGITVLETMMIWQLLQVGHLRDSPLILVGKMWPGLVEWARRSMISSDPPLADPRDMAIPHCVASADEAIAVVREHRTKWLNAQKP